jgi:hypothetical protein
VLNNLTIALFLMLAECGVLLLLGILFHRRLHVWLRHARHVEHHGGAALPDDPEHFDLKSLAENLVQARQMLQTALQDLNASNNGAAMLEPLLKLKLEQVGHYCHQLVDGQSMDAVACQMALSGISEIMALNNWLSDVRNELKSVIDAPLPTGPVLMRAPEKQDGPLSAEAAIEHLANQLLQNQPEASKGEPPAAGAA